MDPEGDGEEVDDEEGADEDDASCGGSGGGQTASAALSDAARSGATSPLNHSRDGDSHSSAMATATIDDMKPPAAIPVTKRGTARTDSPIRAGRWPRRA